MNTNLGNIEIKNSVNDIDKSTSQDNKAKSDLRIWSEFKEGNEAAFIFIYKEYANLLFNFGTKFSDDRELVKDCLQDFFIYLRGAREKLSNTDSIKHYLLKSFRRRVIDYVNKYYSEKNKNNSIAEFQLRIEISDELKYINTQLHEEHISKLNKAIESLDENEKEAVYYFYHEGLTYKEIAEILGYGHVSSIRRLIYKSIDKLKQYFILPLMLLFLF